MQPSILVVDDEESIRYSLERFLLLEGFQVILADDFRQAVERVAEGGIDLVFADNYLPDGTGIDLLKRIQGARPDFPVVIITAYPSVETERECMRHGAFAYIVKPLRQLQVLETAEKALGGKRQLPAIDKRAALPKVYGQRFR